MSEIEEVARATAEASKFGTKALETTEKLASFIAKVFKEPIRDAVGIIGDRLRFMRRERQVRLADRVNEILSQRAVIETKAVPPKLALPILENASLEDNDDLQDLWAKLLANSMDANFIEEIRYAYLEIIKSLSPIDAKILQVVYNLLNESDIDLDKITEHIVVKKDICKGLSISDHECEVSMFNLFRAQCLAPAFETSRISAFGQSWSAYQRIDGAIMTPLGKKFVEVCIK